LVFLVRGVFSPFAHPVFTACTGIGLGLLAAGRTRRGIGAPLLGLLLAIVLHGLWNGTGFVSGGAFLLTFLGIMVPVFVALIVLARKEARRERRVVAEHLRRR
jgi:RsiW-degrading membrane proteinase PrsW (M82 family)